MFDVIKKTDLFDPHDIAGSELNSHEPATVKVERPAERRVSAAPARVASLRVSALEPVFPFDKSHQAAAEEYRIIRTKILHHAAKPRLIVVSSPSSGDGKTVTSVNIAASLALKDEAKVLLLDADLRRPRIADVLGISKGSGLAEVLQGGATLDDVLIRAEQLPNLSILPAGQATGNPAELFDSRHWRALVEQIRARFGHVILDTTPLGAVADYELVQSTSDGVIVVIRPDHTPRKECHRALGIVPTEKLLGVVLNCVEEWWLWKRHSYGYYHELPTSAVTPRRK